MLASCQSGSPPVGEASHALGTRICSHLPSAAGPANRFHTMYRCRHHQAHARLSAVMGFGSACCAPPLYRCTSKAWLGRLAEGRHLDNNRSLNMNIYHSCRLELLSHTVEGSCPYRTGWWTLAEIASAHPHHASVITHRYAWLQSVGITTMNVLLESDLLLGSLPSNVRGVVRPKKHVALIQHADMQAHFAAHSTRSL